MGAFQNYPYADVHQLNLDWIIKIMKEVRDKEDELDQAVSDAQGYAENAHESLLEITDIYDNIKEIIVTPEMFGAKGDGVTDDTDAWKDAINSNKNIYCEKEYLVSDGLVLNEGQSILGTGTLKMSVDGTLLTLQNNCKVMGITFKDTFNIEPSTNGVVVLGNNVSNILLADNKFEDIHLFQCIRLYGENLVINSNLFNGYQEGAIVLHGGSHYVDISNNKILNGRSTTLSYRYPITVSSYDTDSSMGASKYIRVSGNYIEDDNARWEAIDSHGVEDCIIENNIIRGTKTGITLTIPTSAPYVESNNVIIRNNDVQTTTTALSIGTGGKHFIVEGNRFESTAQTNATSDYVCRLLSQSNSYVLNDLKFTKNEVLSTGSTYGGGIYASNNWANISITENVFDGGTSADKAVVNLSALHSYLNVKVNENVFGPYTSVNRCFRGPTSNSNTNKDLVYYMDNRYVNYTEKSRDTNYLCCKRTEGGVSAIVAGQIGDWQPNSNPSGNNVLGWYATTDSDPANNIKATWTPIPFS